MITLGFTKAPKTAARRTQRQLNSFLRICDEVARFMRENNGEDLKAFFSRDGAALGLYLMTKTETYDFELADKLTEFAAPYIERGMLNSVTLLPASTPDELAAFFDPKYAIRVAIADA